jgi:hypothetical protein
MRKKFTAYNKDTGQVLFGGTADNPEVMATESSVIVLDVEYTDGYLVDGVHHALPPQPSEHHVFNYTTKQWDDPRTPETEWPLVRQQRDALLAKSDWTQLPDVPLATKDAWATYRQALRDITLQPDPFNIDWPTVPI